MGHAKQKLSKRCNCTDMLLTNSYQRVFQDGRKDVSISWKATTGECTTVAVFGFSLMTQIRWLGSHCPVEEAAEMIFQMMLTATR